MLKVPKLRGFKSIYAKSASVNLDVLERIVKDGDTITPAFFKTKGLIKNMEGGIKILGEGVLTKKIIVKGCLVSKKAVEAIEKAGGRFVHSEPRK